MKANTILNIILLCLCLLFVNNISISKSNKSEENLEKNESGRCPYKRNNGEGVRCQNNESCSRLGRRCENADCREELNGAKLCTCTNC